MHGIHLHRHPFAVGEAGATLYGGGITALAFAYRLTRDHRRKRRARCIPPLTTGQRPARPRLRVPT